MFKVAPDVILNFLNWLRYFPEQKPLDDRIWDLAEEAVLEKWTKKVETVEAYRARLHRIVLAMPKKILSKVVHANGPAHARCGKGKRPGNRPGLSQRRYLCQIAIGFV